MIRRASPFLAMAVAVLVVFRGTVFGAGTLLDGRPLYNYYPWSEVRDVVGAVAADPEDIDPVCQFLPILCHFGSEIRSGRLPLWCDGILGGFPVAAEGNAAPCNPLRLLCAVLSPLAAYETGLAIRLGLCLLLMRWFLRRRGLSEPAAVLGAFLHALGTLPAFWMLHDHYLFVHALVPLVLGLVEEAARSGRRVAAAGAGIAAGAAVLGGALLYGMALLAGAAVHLGVRRGRRDPFAVVLYVLAALGMAAPALWPALAWSRDVFRDRLGDVFFWYPPWHVPTLAAPLLLGDPVTFPFRHFMPFSAQKLFGLVPQGRAFFAEGSLSVGAAGLLLVVVGWRRVRGTWAALYRAEGAVVLLLTMTAPLFAVLFPAFPVNGWGRFNLFTTFVLATLAAKALDDLRTLTPDRRQALASALSRTGWRLARVTLVLGLAAAAAGILAFGHLDTLRRLLRHELPPLREIVAHLLTPVVLLLPAAALATAWLLLRALLRRPAGAPALALALAAVPALECLAGAAHLRPSWPARWVYPPEAEALLPPPGRRILPVGEGVLPANTALAHGRTVATGYLSLWPRAYAEALYRGRGGPWRMALVPDEAAADPEAMLCDGIYSRQGWRPLGNPVPSHVKASNHDEGWVASCNDRRLPIRRHRGWAMETDPPGPGETVSWEYTAPRFRSGLLLAGLTLASFIAGVLLARRRRGSGA